jgi:hypothetical protein
VTYRTAKRRDGGAAWRPRLLALLATALAALAAPAGAAAHGDPASHYLEAERLYPAFADRPSQKLELELLGLLQAAERRGYPIKVALVANADDLTDNPDMLTEPQRYADFVASELGDRLAAPVLVVTPSGFGVSGRVNRARVHAYLRGVDARRAAHGDALARAAIVAVRRIAQAGGHPLPARVPPAKLLGAGATSTASDSSGLGRWMTLSLFVAVFLLLLLLFEVWIRTSRRRTPRPQADARP